MRKFFTVLLFLFGVIYAKGQATVYYESCGTPGGTTLVNSYAGWDNPLPISYSSTTAPAQSDVRTTLPSSGYASSSGSGNVFMGTSSGNARDFIISGIITTGYTGLTLNFGMLRTSTNDLVVQYSTDGSTYFPITYTPPASTNTWTFINATTALPTTGSLWIKFSKNSTTQYRLDDIYVLGTSLSATNYYSKSAGNLNLLATWGTNTDGSGASPANFTAANQLFNIRNQASPTIGAAWTVSGGGSKVIVGDGVSATNFIVPAAFVYTGSTDVSNAGTLTLNNTTLPTISTLQIGSAVDFAQAATVVVPNYNYYDLKLTNGTKTFASGTINIRGDLTINGVSNINGAASPFTTLSLYGNLTMSGGSTFEPNATGDANRLTLNMEGSPTQTINGGSNPLRIFRLGRVGIATSDSIILGPVTDLVLGNLTSGGLQLNQGASTSTVLVANNNNNITFYGGSYCTATSLGTINSTNASVTMNKTVQNTNVNRLRFGPGAALTNFTVNFGVIANDSFFLANHVTVNGILALTNGKIINDYGQIITMPSTATLTGGGANAWIQGTLKRGLPSNGTTYSFPMGMGGKYAPADIINESGAVNTYEVSYYYQPYSNLAVSAATAAIFNPSPYIVSHVEYWDIYPTTVAPAYLHLYWNGANSYILDESAIHIAHYNGASWDEYGQDNYYGAPAAGSVDVDGLNLLSGAYTFAEIVAGILPIKLHSFTGKALSNSSAKLSWVASCSEIGSSFVLQRSSDAQHFTDVAEISTNGICTNAPFSYTDINAAQGKNYYRLKLVNHSGVIEYSNIILVNLGGRNQITLMQNPVKDVLSVNVSAITTNGTMRVIDMNGKLVATQSFKAGDYNVNINTSSLLAGNYILQVLTGDELITQKFVKF